MSVNIDTEVRPEIRSMLRRLRGRIRQYVLVDAVARVLALLGVLFWLSFGMNYVYFFMTNLELPVGLRMAFGWLNVYCRLADYSAAATDACQGVGSRTGTPFPGTG